MEGRTLTVALRPGEPPPRLEALVRDALPALSRRLVRDLIAAGRVHVNGRPGTKGSRLHDGDHVTLPPLATALAPNAALAVPIVHEDPLVVALDKPGGLRGHALAPEERESAANFLIARYPEMASVGEPLAPGLVHRLDTGTSGLLLAARTSDGHAMLRAALRAHEVEKRYAAVVAGDARALDGTTIVEPLAHDPGDRRRMTAGRPGQRVWPAETRVSVRTHGAERSLLVVTIRTGVTHQVRVHLALRGHPVVNDILYGGPPAPLPPARHALHAARLTLAHPADGRRLVLRAPLPPDLASLVP